MSPSKKLYVFNKLVRDKMLPLFKEDGATVTICQLEDDQKFASVLYAKALEELHELFTASTNEERIEEFADIEEVLYAFKQMYGISQESINKVRQAKNDKRGGYAQRNFLTVVACDQGSKSDTCAIKKGYRQIEEEEYYLLAQALQPTSFLP